MMPKQHRRECLGPPIDVEEIMYGFNAFFGALVSMGHPPALRPPRRPRQTFAV